MANGPWTILIQGTGPFQNNTGGQNPAANQFDADQLMQILINDLSANGHVITDAELQVGSPPTVTRSGESAP